MLFGPPLKRRRLGLLPRPVGSAGPLPVLGDVTNCRCIPPLGAVRPDGQRRTDSPAKPGPPPPGTHPPPPPATPAAPTSPRHPTTATEKAPHPPPEVCDAAATASYAVGGSCGASEPEERVDNCDASETPSGRRPRRLPPSDAQRVYFAVQIEAKVNDEADAGRGLLVLSMLDFSCSLYDSKGRPSGKPKALAPQQARELAVGVAVRYGARTVTLVEAVPEAEFLTGSVFLQPPTAGPNAADPAAAPPPSPEAEEPPRRPGVVIPAGFARPVFRRFRAGTGLVVRKLTDPKVERRPPVKEEPRALFDDTAPDAVVLFKAEYKPYYSVVVDPHLGRRLRPHQRTGVQFMYDCVTGERLPGHFGCILADDMGLGKSIQAIAILWTLLQQGKFGRPLVRQALIVAPSSLVANWGQELRKWLGTQIAPLALAESTEKGDAILSQFETSEDHRVLIISYDQLRKYAERLATFSRVELLICDEGHRLKNAEIKTAKAVASLPAKRRILLSGTPIQNDLGEFYAMVNFTNPGVIGDAATFRAVFELPILAGREPQSEEDKWLGGERARYLSRLTARFILRRTAVVNEKYLPAKVEATVFCRMTGFQLDVYKAILQEARVSDNNKAQALATITTLKKLTNHPDLVYDALRQRAAEFPAALGCFPPGYRVGAMLGDASGKVRVLDGLIQAMRAGRSSDGSRDRVVVVSNYTQTLDVLAALCRRRGWPFFQLDGNTPIKRRQELVDRFNRPDAKEIVFLLSSKAGGVGLNLIGANRLVLYDPDWNPANDAQAMARVWREGQKKKVFIYRFLTTGSIEEKIYQRQVNKQGLSTTVVDCNQDAKQHFTTAELQALFTYKDCTECDTHDLLRCRACGLQTGAERADAAEALRRGFRVRAAGPRMDELRGWLHFRRAADVHVDPVLGQADREANLVSFVFATERDAAKVCCGEVQEEQPFQRDATHIHVEADG